MSEFYLSDISERDRVWDDHRALADTVRDLYQAAGYGRYAERVAECSLNLWFHWTTEPDTGEKKLRLNTARFCRVRHCPTCQWRRSLMWKARMMKALPTVLADFPTCRWVFLTLTARNCPIGELRPTVKGMNEAWTRLSERKQFPALGYVKSVEITRSKDGTAHPHFHILLMVESGYFAGRNYIKQSQWRLLWQQALRVNYDPVVDVRTVKPKGEQSSTDAIISAVKETLKYSVKPGDLIQDADWLRELTQQLHKTRAVSVGGVLRQYLSDEEPTDDELICGDELQSSATDDEIQWWFGWREQIKRYSGDVQSR